MPTIQEKLVAVQDAVKAAEAERRIVFQEANSRGVALRKIADVVGLRFGQVDRLSTLARGSQKNRAIPCFPSTRGLVDDYLSDPT